MSHWQGSVHCGCRAAPPQLENTRIQQKHNPTTISPARSQHHPGQTPPHLLHTTDAAFDLAVAHGMLRADHPHTSSALCAVRCGCRMTPPHLENSSIQQNQNPQTTCAAQTQHPVQALPQLLQTAEAALGLTVTHGMHRAGHSNTGRALCAVVAELRLYI